MPTYHFRCNTCASETELRLSLGSEELPMCETCKKIMTKIMRPPVVHFKGTGFYKTDSSKTVTSKPKEHTEPKTPDPKPSETKPVESKPTEKKPEPKVTPPAPQNV